MLAFSDWVNCDVAASDGSIYEVTDKMTDAINSEHFYSASVVLPLHLTFSLPYNLCYCR